jgi:hypothetical protein
MIPVQLRFFLLLKIVLFKMFLLWRKRSLLRRYLSFLLELLGWYIYRLGLREKHGALGCSTNHRHVKVLQGGLFRWYLYSVHGVWAFACGNFFLPFLDSSLCFIEE